VEIKSGSRWIFSVGESYDNGDSICVPIIDSMSGAIVAMGIGPSAQFDRDAMISVFARL